MYELVQAGARTYYVDCPAKMGLYIADGGEAWLIDSGNDKEAGKKVLKLLDANGWHLAAVINTHSNADHIGGNHLLQERTGCPIYTEAQEASFTRFPMLEPSFLYGGYPCKELRNKFLTAQPSEARELSQDLLPAGIETLALPGHFFGMFGVKTPDNVWFLADCLSGDSILEKYHIPFIYDVAAYLQTLERVKALSAALFVPAHAAAVREIAPLADRNIAKVREVAERILTLCAEPKGFEELLAALFGAYGLTMDFNQYVLVGSTVRSYLSWLHDDGRLHAEFSENRLLWSAV